MPHHQARWLLLPQGSLRQLLGHVVGAAPVPTWVMCADASNEDVIKAEQAFGQGDHSCTKAKLEGVCTL